MLNTIFCCLQDATLQVILEMFRISLSLITYHASAIISYQGVLLKTLGYTLEIRGAFRERPEYFLIIWDFGLLQFSFFSFL